MLATFTMFAMARSAPAAGEEVEVGFERALGLALALRSAPTLLRCPDTHRVAPAAERAPAHRAAHPIVVRIEPRRCDGHARDGLRR